MHLDWAWGWFTKPPTSVWGLDEDTWFLVFFFQMSWWLWHMMISDSEILQVNRFMACDIYDLIEYIWFEMFHRFFIVILQWQEFLSSHSPCDSPPSLLSTVVGGDSPNLPRRRYAAPPWRKFHAPGSDAVVVLGGNAKWLRNSVVEHPRIGWFGLVVGWWVGWLVGRLVGGSVGWWVVMLMFFVSLKIWYRRCHTHNLSWYHWRVSYLAGACV